MSVSRVHSHLKRVISKRGWTGGIPTLRYFVPKLHARQFNGRELGPRSDEAIRRDLSLEFVKEIVSRRAQVGKPQEAASPAKVT